MRNLCLSVLFLALLPMAASAKMVMNGTGTGCLTENAQVSISFNGTEPDIAVIKSKFDAKIEEMKKLSQQAGIEKLDLQSMNYNINPQGSNEYQFNGNASFMVSPAD